VRFTVSSVYVSVQFFFVGAGIFACSFFWHFRLSNNSNVMFFRLRFGILHRIIYYWLPLGKPFIAQY